jgi:ribosome-binding protein aMBF1 (putative translation factor)
MSTKVSAKPTKDWHHKIAASRKKNANWKKNIVLGRRDAQINPSVIRLLRLKRGIQQSDIATKLKISESSFGAIERGRAQVNKELASQIAKILASSPQAMFKQGKKKKLVAIIKSSSI